MAPLQPLVTSFALILLSSLLVNCSTVVRLPEPKQAAFTVRWNPPSPPDSTAKLTLTPKYEETNLAQAKSLFDNETVEAIGTPTTDRLQVYSSPSNLTVIAYEDAGESSPSEQLVLFKRKSSDAHWSVEHVSPPRKAGPLYGIGSTTLGVDDDFLYYQFPKGNLKRIKLAHLQAKPSL